MSIVTDANGLFNYTTASTEGGRFQATATLIGSSLASSNESSYSSSFTSYNVKSITFTWPAFMLYLGLGFFIALVIVIFLGQRIAEAANIIRVDEKVALVEIIRFVCLTGIASSFIFALLFSDVEIGANSPLGLVRKNTSPVVTPGTVTPTSNTTAATIQQQSAGTVGYKHRGYSCKQLQRWHTNPSYRCNIQSFRWIFKISIWSKILIW